MWRKRFVCNVSFPTVCIDINVEVFHRFVYCICFGARECLKEIVLHENQNLEEMVICL